MLDRETRIVRVLQRLYPADNELGFDLGKVIRSKNELQEAVQIREESDIALKQEGKELTFPD